MIRSGDLPISNDDELLTDALMGNNKGGGSGSHGSFQGVPDSAIGYAARDTGDLKKDLHAQMGYDVKIGDGMDIGIHGENGNYLDVWVAHLKFEYILD